MPYKWNFLLKAKSINIPLISVIKVYFISNFLGFFMPPTVGQDAVRAYYISRRNHPLQDVISSILVERFIGILAILIFCLIGSSFFFIFYSGNDFDIFRFAVINLLIFIFCLLGFFISLNRKVFSKTLKSKKPYFLRILPEKYFVKMLKLYESYVEYGKNKLVLTLFFILTCFEICLPVIRSYIITIALGVDIPILYFFAFVPIILVLIRLPISFDGFGLHEGGFVFFLSLMGVANETGFTVGILNHLIFLVGILPGGLFYMLDAGGREAAVEAASATDTSPH
jgi:uncharacterized protein (TIRG00374 family)